MFSLIFNLKLAPDCGAVIFLAKGFGRSAELLLSEYASATRRTAVSFDYLHRYREG
jgi:hypothetical protein